MPAPISPAVRFSVESLLYYAPKIISTGTALASAVTTVQRQLSGLGDFYGGSWPDQPFRDSYPRSQDAVLIIATQLADEIQGIGGGIEQMARNYGITENQNTADISRIEANQGHISELMYHTGGFASPPDNPLALQSSPVRSLEPDPQAGAAPSASAPGPTATRAAAAPQAPVVATSPTPSPEPGADPTSWRVSGASSMLGPWPSGDPGRMEEAAACWNTLISALDTAWSDLQRYTAYILADDQGAAATAFSDYADGLTAPGGGSLTRTIQAAQDLHDVCLQQAAEVRSLRRTLEQAGLELLAGVVITQVFSALTFETTQELADAVDAGLAARLTELAENAAQYSARLAEILKSSAVAASKVLSAGFASAMQSGLIGEADFGANQLIGLAFGEKPQAGVTSLRVFAENFGIGFFLGQGSAGGLLGLSAAAASKKLMDLGEVLTSGQGSEASTGKLLVVLGRQLKDGSITVSAANSAATDLLTSGGVTPVSFFSNTFSNRLSTALSPHTGKHVAH